VQNILQRKDGKANQLHELKGYDHKLETQISDTKLQMRDLFGSFAQPSRTWHRGLQRLGDVRPVSELKRGFGRLASLMALRSSALAEIEQGKAA